MSVCVIQEHRPRARRRRAGQTLTEFAIIVFLVAVGTIGVVGVFGDNLRRLFGASANAVAGGTRVANEGTQAPASLEKWSMKGATDKSGNPGGSTNKDTNPGGTANTPGPRGNLGNPGGSTNSEGGGGVLSKGDD